MVNGDGLTARRAVTAILQTVIAALAIAAILGLLNLRDRIGIIESAGNQIEIQRALQHQIDTHDGRIGNLEMWKAEGRRFTTQDAEKMHAEFMREIDRLQRQIDNLSGRRSRFNDKAEFAKSRR